MRRWLLAGAVVAVLLLALAAGIGAVVLSGRFERPGPLVADLAVVIPRGAGLNGIARQLEGEGVIADTLAFRLGVYWYGQERELRAGEYRFPAGASMHQVMEILSGGETVIRRLTVPEGLTSAEVVELVAAAHGLSGETGPIPDEGSLLPETYHYSWDDDRGELMGRMGEALDEALDELWPRRDPDLPIDSPEEAVILASIVEKETGVPEERPLVASVFINRLKRGMRLQSDPTVVYGLTLGSGPLGRPLSRKDLDAPSPYNTYLNHGLPPGPIANVGRAALEAVLKPATSTYLYFVADGSGGHVFAETLAEHNRNVANWRKIQRRKKQAAE